MATVRETFGSARPEDIDRLAAFDAFDEEFVAPAACIGCVVLTAKNSAESIGMMAARRNGKYEYFPEGKIAEAKETLVQRADDAVSGACKFIVKTQCWRIEEIREE